MRDTSGYFRCDDADPARGQPRVIEGETRTCIHCNTLVFDWAQTGGWCTRCDAAICVRCGKDGSCVPYEVRLEQMERRITDNLERERAYRGL